MSGSRTFLKGSIASQAAWHKTDPWRKRQGYSHIVSREILCRPSHKPYHNFRWEDHVLRERLRKTYDRRHLPLSNGTITPPPWWSSSCVIPPSWSGTESHNSSNTTARPTPDRNPSPVHKNVLEWDSDEEEWIASTKGTEMPLAAPAAPTRPQKKKNKKRDRDTSTERPVVKQRRSDHARAKPRRSPRKKK